MMINGRPLRGNLQKLKGPSNFLKFERTFVLDIVGYSHVVLTICFAFCFNIDNCNLNMALWFLIVLEQLVSLCH